MMKNTEKIKLIDGNFTNSEAKEILSNAISSKINFYNIKDWSSQERFGKNDAVAQKRIPELRNEMKKLEDFLSEAKNKRLVIKSEIFISILED